MLKLKPANVRKLAKKNESDAAPPATSASGTDLLGALAARLQMRRKGISGAEKGREGAAKAADDEDAARPPAPSGGMMGNLANLIPKMPSAGSDAGNGSEGDWED